MSWLYVPESADSTSESNSPIRQPDAFVMLRGKPTQPQSLSGVWRRGGWIRLLSGLTLDRSTASRGAARWRASLEDTRANHSPRQDSGVDTKTTDTSGPASNASSRRCGPVGVSSRTSRDTYRWDLKPSPMTCKEWATRLRRVCSQRKRSVLAMREKGSSLWPTPRAHGGGGQGLAHGAAWVQNNFKQPHFRVNNKGVRMSRGAGKSFDVTLKTAAKGWADWFFRLHQMTQWDGCRKTLCLSFVENLMGLPTRWTEIERGPAATQWSHWWRRMRGEYLKAVSRWRHAEE